MKIRVCYLCRRKEGIETFRRFLASYKNFDAGCEHELLIIFKGDFWQAYDYQIALDGIKYKSFYINDVGYDLYAYGKAMRISCAFDILVFLNSHSEINTNYWLNYLVSDMLHNDRIGLIGATYSMESFSSRGNILKRLLFPTPPNIHIRTNAFAIRRDLMAKIWSKWLLTKWQSYLLESGYNSLARRVERSGFQFSILPNRSFRLNQELLLVKDNQTRAFDNASKQEQNRLTYLAYGISQSKE